MSDQSTIVEPADEIVTKRLVIAQVALCMGCCCGNVARKKPAVPVDKLKAEWKRLGLSKAVQLTVSGCLGPCDVLNVVRVSGRNRDEWIGNLTSTEDFLHLALWAEQSKNAGKYVPLPQLLHDKRFDPFLQPERVRANLDQLALPNAAAGGTL